MILLLGGGGCASFCTRVMSDAPQRPEVYPSIRMYAEGFAERQHPDAALTAFWVIDAPLSFVVDTLLIPFDLAQQAGWDQRAAGRPKGS